MLLIGLSKPELFRLAQEAVRFIFAGENVKKSLEEVFKHAEKISDDVA
jgi:adenosine deaminase